MKRSLFFTFALILMSFLRAETPEERLSVSVGGGVLYAPAFLGAKDYQWLAVPSVKLNYGRTFFASVEEGAGWNLLGSDTSWSAGPLVKMGFSRRENGANPFRVAGEKTNALRGLGDVNTTFEAGAFVDYREGPYHFSAKVVQGVGGHKGALAELSARRSWNVATLLYEKGPPIIVSVGPSLRFASENYVKSYFGVTPLQATRSGLPVFSPGSGLLDYGVSSSVVVPLTREWSVLALLRYSRLGGDAGSSPLVVQRGSRNQMVGGIILAYQFGATR